MSIIGIGTDLVEISRIQKILFQYKNHFAKRILSIQEWNHYIETKNKLNFLAKKFSAKEAACKALGTGINNGIQFNELEFYHDLLGKPQLRFLKNAFKRSQELKCKFVHVSISDQKKYAYALVILEA
ncbi:holo-ACP synthase [Buchnera aphidicola (Macrosiphoniella sanborni)]|uniref:Holo-[acyl-carrier-protein] synthase n=1 Tax=Buchnera aphidicola (Macrosiphoniella sanborni) TaxID=1241865 RepID=A0A4D6YCQ8_9GAMM|nr:holo-ACP synthase [Buchnera aphidicola]QCI23798.1 holo-ACP synthase [Buchnera aphidicola (Macrosiphoniella sanborni)]